MKEGEGVAKGHVHMIHGHGQWRRDCLRERGRLGGRGRWGERGTSIIVLTIKVKNNKKKCIKYIMCFMSPFFHRNFTKLLQLFKEKDTEA